MDKFLVSARKYRPVTFESVIGQFHITSTLRNAIDRNQLAHAYLFCGPRGVGKTTCARIFAKAINCLSPMGSEACGECESCRGFNEGRSFNIHELDAASNNSVDDIRSLTDQVRIPPQIGKYSVYIIDEVHMLSAQAFNAFLKTLEEPPAHAIFILATTEKHKIIPTILSRCQIFDFNRIRVEDGVGYLKHIASKEGVVYDDESLHLIAQKADGGMRDALSMFDKAVSFCGDKLHFKEVAQTLNVLDYDTYFNITSLILAGDYPSTLTLFDDVLRKGFSGQTFIGGLNTHFRDMLMCKDVQTMALLEVSGTLLERYRKQSEECDVGFLFSSIALLTTLDGTLRTATNQRLNVELGLMKLCGLGQKKKLASAQNNQSGAGGEAEGAAGADVGKAGAYGVGSVGGVGVAGMLESDDAPTLPPLVKGNAVDSSVANQTTVKSAAQSTQAQPAQPQKEPSPVASAQAPMSAPASAQAPMPAPAQATRENRASSPNAPKTELPQVRKAASSIISGASISDLMGRSKINDVPYTENEAGGVEEGVRVANDPACEAKIAAATDKFIEILGRSRPRIAMAFHNMRVTGDEISLSVPTEPLREEILRNRTEILTLLIETAEINGVVRLNVDVAEDSSPMRPIKFEDKLQYLTEQNPKLTRLRQALDLIE